MKHQSFSKSVKAEIQDSKLDDHGQKRPACKSKPRPTCEPLHKKPFTGRVFYLDLPCNKRSQTLESDIKSLGGTVEKFFSKEIRYLVSNKPEARHVQRLVQDSPVPSPDSGLSSPHPASKRDSHGHRGSSQGPTDTAVVSRGKSLVEKVVKEQERVQINRILANALEWGVKILYIDDVISYIDKKKTKLSQESTVRHTVRTAVQPDATERPAFQKCSAGRISRPFVKVEDSSRHYRPIYLPMANMPVCNFKSAAPCSPFLVDENDNDAPGKKTKVHGSERDRGVKGRKDRRRGHEGKARRKGGYCECCLVKYDSLKAHLQGEQHQAFSKSEEYLVVDRVISGLTCDLIQISTQTKRVKCSVSSPVLAPGPAIKTEGEEGVLEVEEEKVTAFTLWSSHNTDFSGGTPRPLRKRCRALSLSPEEDAAEQSDALEKSESKRGSFEWGSSSALHKALTASLCNSKKGCYSDSLQRSRTPLHVHSKPRTSLSAQPARRHVSCNQLDARSVRETQGTNVVAEPSGTSQPNVHATQKTVLDVTGMQRPLSKAGHVPVRTEQPSDTTTHGSVTVERSLSSRGYELVSTDSPSRTLQRKVRNSRRRRKALAEASQGLSGKRVEPLTPQTFGKASEPLTPSASAQDLCYLFMSGDDIEDEFKGF
ncbi:protein DBF4 homolog A isoform X2 [Colossoma macropomum]|uniref:protein DBF4 homolog A isoform X2 n=1 Tax=Colossoma macropomum TaxID=42526 RepID=UPI001864DAC6|nr:protein DBF4 homolog A isoform X2 [Colossoma macropomum]XP_036414798.1 protein DBF4 homolog A isoform X2 [Colossoma macropomum]